MSAATIEDVLAAVHRLEQRLDELVGREFYTPAEVASLTGFTPESIRDRCADGRIKASRKDGVRDAWEIPASELAKIPRKRRTLSPTPR
jgi:hypothetical protein